jgi:hypothetical protein
VNACSKCNSYDHHSWACGRSAEDDCVCGGTIGTDGRCSKCKGHALYGGPFVETNSRQRDMSAAYPPPSECLSWCGDFDVAALATSVGMMIKGSVFALKDKKSGKSRSFCCLEKAMAAAGLRMDRTAQPQFHGEGIAPLLVKAHRDLVINADAERLAELRGRREQLRVLVDALRDGEERNNHMEERARLKVLIAVYEECAARGRTFGGGA